MRRCSNNVEPRHRVAVSRAIPSHCLVCGSLRPCERPQGCGHTQNAIASQAPAAAVAPATACKVTVSMVGWGCIFGCEDWGVAHRANDGCQGQSWRSSRQRRRCATGTVIITWRQRCWSRLCSSKDGQRRALRHSRTWLRGDSCREAACWAGAGLPLPLLSAAAAATDGGAADTDGDTRKRSATVAADADQSGAKVMCRR